MPGRDPGNIVHINAAGVLFRDRAILPAVNPKKPIYFEEIRNVKIYRKRAVAINVAGFLAALGLCANAAMGHYTTLERVFLLVYSVVFLGVAIFYKNVKYQLTVVYRDTQPVNVELARFIKDDAKYMALKINKAVNSKR